MMTTLALMNADVFGLSVASQWSCNGSWQCHKPPTCCCYALMGNGVDVVSAALCLLLLGALAWLSLAAFSYDHVSRAHK